MPMLPNSGITTTECPLYRSSNTSCRYSPGYAGPRTPSCGHYLSLSYTQLPPPPPILISLKYKESCLVTREIETTIRIYSNIFDQEACIERKRVQSCFYFFRKHFENLPFWRSFQSVKPCANQCLNLKFSKASFILIRLLHFCTYGILYWFFRFFEESNRVKYVRTNQKPISKCPNCKKSILRLILYLSHINLDTIPLWYKE
jgi:hypothetical protein